MKPEACQMKTHDIIAVLLLAILLTVQILSFFWVPKYLDGVKDINQAMIDALGMILSFKFGVHVAQQQAGTTSITAQITPPKEEGKKDNVGAT